MWRCAKMPRGPRHKMSPPGMHRTRQASASIPSPSFSAKLLRSGPENHVEKDEAPLGPYGSRRAANAALLTRRINDAHYNSSTITNFKSSRQVAVRRVLYLMRYQHERPARLNPFTFRWRD